MSNKSFCGMPSARCRGRFHRMHASALLVLASMALAAGCSSDSGNHAPSASSSPHNVTLTQAQRASIHVRTVAQAHYHSSIDAAGIVDFDRNQATPVLAPFSGPVTKLLVTLGQDVAQGQVLARVDSPDFATAVGAYRKALVLAHAADQVAANDRDLAAHKAISARENAQAQADAVGADADRTAALQALVAMHMDRHTIAAIAAGKRPARDQGEIRAPIAGTVVERSISPGETLVAGSTPCFTIADTSKMWVIAKVFGADVGRVKMGDTAAVDIGDGSKLLTGTVTNVGSVVDTDTRAVGVRVRLDNNDGALKKGMYVDVRIQSRQPREGLLIPVAAVLRDDENLPFVYVLQADGSYAQRSVTLDQRVDDRYVISKGLHAGDKVVVDGSIFLHFIQTQ